MLGIGVQRCRPFSVFCLTMNAQLMLAAFVNAKFGSSRRLRRETATSFSLPGMDLTGDYSGTLLNKALCGFTQSDVSSLLLVLWELPKFSCEASNMVSQCLLLLVRRLVVTVISLHLGTTLTTRLIQWRGRILILPHRSVQL